MQSQMSNFSSEHMSSDDHGIPTREGNYFHDLEVEDTCSRIQGEGVDNSAANPGEEEDNSAVNPREEDNPAANPRSSSNMNSKLWITVLPNREFEPQKECQDRLRETIENKYRGDSVCWTKIDSETRDMMFDYWKSFFQWDPSITLQVRRLWESRGSITFKHKMQYVRTTCKGEKKPNWVGINTWNKFKETWASSDYQALARRNKANRLSNSGGREVVVHRSGSMSRSRCIKKSKNNLENTTQHPETQAQGDSYEPPIELQRQVPVETQGVSKNITVVNLESDAEFVRPSSSSETPSQNPTYDQNELVTLKNEFKDYKVTMEQKVEELQDYKVTMNQKIDGLATKMDKYEAFITTMMDRHKQFLVQPAEQIMHQQ